MSRRRVVIAGGSGFIGHALLQELQEDYEVVILSRSGKPIEGATVETWDGKTLGDWARNLDGAEAVINLAGEPVTLRWTEENKKKILESRTESTAVIGKAVRGCVVPPKVWINGSAVGYYGDTGDREVDETSPAGEGFLAETCLAWERAQEEVETPQTRKVRIRIGFVLGKEGGALPELWKITRRFLGGSQGSGQQWVPWIHISDLAGIFRWVIENEVSGPVNGVGPSPVRNKELMAEIRRAAHRPWSPPAPAFALNLVGAIIGVQTDVTLVSQRVVSKTLKEGGFEYRFPTLQETIADQA